MDEETCYVLKRSPGLAAMKRRGGIKGFQASQKIRMRTYHLLWQAQQDRIDAVINKANEDVAKKIMGFISTPSLDHHDDKLQVGFITTGSSGSTAGNVFDHLGTSISFDRNLMFVHLHSSDCPNLKAFLKALIRRGAHAGSLVEEDAADAPNHRSGMRLLNFDLHALEEYSKKQQLQRIVVAFSDSDSYDALLLSEILILLRSWLDRIPFILLLGVATTVEQLQDRMSRAAIRCITGRQFNTVSNPEMLETIFQSVNSTKRTPLRLGPGLSRMLLQRQVDHSDVIHALIATIKYGYMCHFWANPLTVFLGANIKFSDITPEHFAALRNLPSFRRHIELLLARENTQLSRRLLESDEALFNEVLKQLESSQDQATWSLGAIRVLQVIQNHLSSKPAASYSSLFVKVLSGDNDIITTCRELVLLLRKISSDTLVSLFPMVMEVMLNMPLGNEGICPNDLANLQNQLQHLLRDISDDKLPLRSEQDFHQQTLRTTIVAKKVELSRQKTRLSTHDTAYTQILNDFASLLEAYFGKVLVASGNVFLQEILFYDLKIPHRDVFGPRPVTVMERALSMPHDYLSCTCCGNTTGELVVSQPPVAILYQLCLESGVLINASDLWSAFEAMLRDQLGDENTIPALFLQSLAQLKYLGFLKQSRKKLDHLGKLAWKGL